MVPPPLTVVFVVAVTAVAVDVVGAIAAWVSDRRDRRRHTYYNDGSDPQPPNRGYYGHGGHPPNRGYGGHGGHERRTPTPEQAEASETSSRDEAHDGTLRAEASGTLARDQEDDGTLRERRTPTPEQAEASGTSSRDQADDGTLRRRRTRTTEQAEASGTSSRYQADDGTLRRRRTRTTGQAEASGTSARDQADDGTLRRRRTLTTRQQRRRTPTTEQRRRTPTTEQAEASGTSSRDQADNGTMRQPTIPSKRSQDDVVDDEKLQEVSGELGEEWKMIARTLGENDAQIKRIVQRNNSNVRESIYQVLKGWKSRDGDSATYRKLIRALEKEERRDLAQRIQRSLSGEEPSTCYDDMDRDLTDQFKNQVPREFNHTRGYRNKAERINVLLLGKTGNGKSTTGNTLIGSEPFSTASSLDSCTSTIEKADFTCEGIPIRVIDTPGLMDTKYGGQNNQDVLCEIVKIFLDFPEGVHVFLIICQSTGRFTRENIDTITEIQNTFGPDLCKRGLLVMTHADTFLKDGWNVTDFVNSSRYLNWFLEQLSNQVIGIENCPKKGRDDAKIMQVQRSLLLNWIYKIVDKNDGKPYVSSSFKISEEAIEKVHQKKREICDIQNAINKVIKDSMSDNGQIRDIGGVQRALYRNDALRGMDENYRNKIIKRNIKTIPRHATREQVNLREELTQFLGGKQTIFEDFLRNKSNAEIECIKEKIDKEEFVCYLPQLHEKIEDKFKSREITDYTNMLLREHLKIHLQTRETLVRKFAAFVATHKTRVGITILTTVLTAVCFSSTVLLCSH